MAGKVYAVIGATGQIGHVIVEYLLKRGHHVKAFGRDQKKLGALKAKGAQVISLEGVDREAVLNKEFKGVDAAFGMIPPNYDIDSYGAYQDQIGEAIKGAVQINNVRHLVNLSSLGGHLAEGTGPIKGLYRQEKRLKSLATVQILHLRPGYFMENFLWSIPVIKQTGVLKTPLKLDFAFPMVATQDIGLKAADFLDRLDFKGHTVFEFVGPRVVTMEEAAKILGKAIGKPDLKCVHQSYEEAEKGMLASGMKPGIVKLFVEMYQAFNQGLCEPTQKLTSDHYGKTTIEQFAHAFAEAYKKQAEKVSVH